MQKVILSEGGSLFAKDLSSFRMTVLGYPVRSGMTSGAGRTLLDDSLLKHSLCDLHEAGDVCTLHVVDVTVRLSTVLHASLVDVRHDAVKFLINLSRTPTDMHCVLSHLKT